MSHVRCLAKKYKYESKFISNFLRENIVECVERRTLKFLSVTLIRDVT